MVGLLEFRQKLKEIYGRYSTYIIPCVKFVMVFVTLMMMNRHMGYMKRLDSMTIVLLISLICSILPQGVSTFFVGVFLLAHLSALSYVAAGVALVALLVMFCTYYIFQPKDSCLLYLVPLLFLFKIPHLAPFVMGLTGSLFSAIPICFGTFLYYMLRWIGENSMVLASSSTMSPLQQLSEMASGLLRNEEMVVFMIAFVAVLCVVYLFRRMAVKYNWEIAIGMGMVVDIVIILIGASSLDLNLDLVPVIVGALLCAGLSLVLEFFIFLVDYNRTIQTQFEDDEYYYYVKAVPKVAVAPAEKSVKKITPPRKTRKAAARIEEEEEERRSRMVSEVHAGRLEEAAAEEPAGAAEPEDFPENGESGRSEEVQNRELIREQEELAAEFAALDEKE